jgi:hypothetical protein
VQKRVEIAGQPRDHRGAGLVRDRRGVRLQHDIVQGEEARIEIGLGRTRFNTFMPGFIRHFRLRMVGGKGGLDSASAQAMREVGCVYLSFLGGGAALHTDAIREVVRVAWEDLVSHYRLVKLRVEDLGPLVVAIDSHGNSLFESLGKAATDRLPQILRELDAGRAAFASKTS